MANPKPKKNRYLLGESLTTGPLLTSIASASWCPFHASAGVLHTKPFPI